MALTTMPQSPPLQLQQQAPQPFTQPVQFGPASELPISPVSLNNVPGYQQLWQQYLQRQAAWQQQAAQMAHQLGPFSNALGGNAANMHQLQMMQYLIGQG